MKKLLSLSLSLFFFFFWILCVFLGFKTLVGGRERVRAPQEGEKYVEIVRKICAKLPMMVERAGEWVLRLLGGGVQKHSNRRGEK
jgi:hypothetical protein